MRGFEVEPADNSWHERRPSDSGSGPGLCRLGEALTELLALYPVTIEMEPAETAVLWMPEHFQDAACELATA